MLKMTIHGVDEAIRKLDQLAKKAEALDGQHDVPLNELMPDSFVRRYTDYQSLQAMVDAGGIDTSDDLHGEDWNNFVASHSRFGGWKEMQNKAVAEWTKKKLGL
jgi:hypothetical protein